MNKLRLASVLLLCKYLLSICEDLWFINRYSSWATLTCWFQLPLIVKYSKNVKRSLVSEIIEWFIEDQASSPSYDLAPPPIRYSLAPVELSIFSVCLSDYLVYLPVLLSLTCHWPVCLPVIKLLAADKFTLGVPKRSMHLLIWTSKNACLKLWNFLFFMKAFAH